MLSFQEASLFPHLSVRDNLLYGARRALRNGDGRRIREDDIVDLLGIGHLLDCGAQALSGGERQHRRRAGAVSQPSLLLMDKPLSALDRMAKEDILPYFGALHEHLSLPIVYVSHDIGGVERLADHVVLMEKGRAVAQGRLKSLKPIRRCPYCADRMRQSPWRGAFPASIRIIG